MMLRGVFQNGVVVLNDSGNLANGTVVDVKPSTAATAQSRSKKKTKKKVLKKASSKRALDFSPPLKGNELERRVKGFMSLAGIWKDRPEWKGMTSVEIAADLRKKALKRN